MQLSVLCLPPLQAVFRTVTMDAVQWGTVLALAVTPVIVCETVKAVSRTQSRHGAHRETRPSPASKHPATVK